MIRECLMWFVVTTLVADASAYQCVFCSVGKYKDVITNDVCTQCPQNTYMDWLGADDVSDCIACPANSQSGLGSTQITDCQCKIGYFGQPGGPCTPCVAGRYAATVGQSACSFCPSYTNSPVPSGGSVNDELTDCTCIAGYTGANGVACTACALHTYKTATGNADCSLCVDKTMTLALGSTNINDCICTPGYTAGGGSVVCTGCSTGKYKVGSGPAVCTDCGVNKYSEAVAATAEATCTNCPGVLGTSVSLAGNGLLGGCKCNLGYTGPDGAVCSACIAGKYKTATGAALCDLCAVDTFSTVIAKTTSDCTQCSNINRLNFITDGTTGQDELTDCKCEPGYTGVDGETCYGCVAGKYKTTAGSVDCTLCGQGKFSTATASATGAVCLNCPTNSNAPLGSSAAAGCTCDAGYTGPGGLVACSVCLAGTFKVATGPAACSICPADWYSTAVGATSDTCQTCPANSMSSAGSSLESQCVCKPGYTGPNGGPCIACVAGKFKTTSGTAECTDCPLHTFSVVTAKADSTCSACLTNAVTLQTGSALATQCVCNLGYYGANGASVSCAACEVGKHKSTTGTAACTSCGDNTYQPLTAQTNIASCTSCPSQYAVSPTGSSAITSCQCKPGYTNPDGRNGESCAPCWAGEYKTSNGPQACTKCVNGTYSTAFAASSIDTCATCHANTASWAGSSARTDCHCLEGFYTKDLGLQNASCWPCAAGTYNSILNMDACSKCTRGKFSVISQSTSKESCLVCPGGYSGEGFTQCDPCPLHATAPPESGYQTDCKCHRGFTGADGATCQSCVAGKFKPTNGSALCTDCPLDTYSPDTALVLQTQCRNCLGNAQAPPGSDSYDDCKCKVGYTASVQPGADGTACAACSTGKYKDAIGHAECSLCPVHTYVDTTTSTSVGACIPCFDNSQSFAGSDALDDCRCIGGFERAVS